MTVDGNGLVAQEKRAFRQSDPGDHRDQGHTGEDLGPADQRRRRA